MNKLMKILVISAGFILLSGCAHQMSVEEYTKLVSDHCSGAGYTPQTPEHSQCMLVTHEQIQARQWADNQASKDYSYRMMELGTDTYMRSIEAPWNQDVRYGY